MKIEISAKLEATVTFMYILDAAACEDLSTDKLEETGQSLLEYAQENATASKVVCYGTDADKISFEVWRLSEDGARGDQIGEAMLAFVEDMDEFAEADFSDEVASADVVIPALDDDRVYYSDEFSVEEGSVIILEENAGSEVFMSCIVEISDEAQLSDLRARFIAFDGPDDFDQFLYENIQDDPEYHLIGINMGLKEFSVEYELEMDGLIEVKAFTFVDGAFEEFF
jgi:hypothetical protein